MPVLDVPENFIKERRKERLLDEAREIPRAPASTIGARISPELRDEVERIKKLNGIGTDTDVVRRAIAFWGQCCRGD